MTLRYGLVSDVHANLAALRRALDALAAAGVDQILCAGDVVGFGPQPNECVSVLAQAGIPTVAGNHDLMAIGRLEPPAVEVAQVSTAFTSAALGEAERAWLGALPPSLDAPGVVVAHGALDSAQRYVTTPAASAAQLAEMSRRSPDARVLVLGHTHRPRLYQPSARSGNGAGTGSGAHVRREGGLLALRGGPALCNPGSVGQSRQAELVPRVRCAVLELPLAGRGAVAPSGTPSVGSVRFLSLRYDDGATRAALTACGLPASWVHIVPGRTGAALRRVRRVIRNAGARTH